MPEFANRKRNSSLNPARRPSLRMHSSQCAICRHPQRAEIERDFLDWTSPGDITQEYAIASRTMIYRHAHALGLFERRRRTLQFALGRLIEQVDYVRPTAASVVSAIRLMAKLNARSEYAEETEAAEPEDLPEVTPAEAATESEPGSQAAEGGDSAKADETPGAGELATTRANARVAPGSGAAEPASSEREKPGLRPKRTVGNGSSNKGEGDESGEKIQPIVFAQNLGPFRRFWGR